MKRILTLMLALLMVLSMLVACADEPSETPDAPDTPDTPSTPSTPDAPEEPASDRIPLELPELYYGGVENVHILQWSAGGNVESGTGWIPWEEGDVQEYSDNIIEQAVFARNAWVEEQLGVTITAEYISVDQGYQNKLQQDMTVRS